MTGKIDLAGDRAIIEENGELSVYALADVEEEADGSWGPVDGASPSGGLNVGALHSGELSGTHIPDQGEVQAALDAAAADGGGTVMLRPNVDYDPAAPWNVGHDVTLDCNGATIVPTTDTDIINVHPQATVLNPRIDVSGITHTSNVFTFDTAFQGDYFQDGPTVVDGGWTLGGFDGTTVLYLYQNNGEAMSNVHVRHNTVDCDVSCDIHSPETTGHINGNWFSGYWSDDRIGIYTHGENANGNLFDVILEPGSFSEVGWDLQAGSHNKLRGYVWDAQVYSTAPWRIGASAGEYNIMRAIGSGYGIQNHMVDNKNSPTNNLISGTKRTPVTQSATNLPDNAAVGTEIYVQDDDRYYYWKN